MAGFDFSRGRSNNMVMAEESGKMTIGRWAKRHGVSARAAVEVMNPAEAHHTGTGYVGRSRLTPVIRAGAEPTPEQLAAMRAWDRGERPLVRGWYVKWLKDYSGPYGRRRNIPTLGVYCGDPKDAPRDLSILSNDDYLAAQPYQGRALKPYASHWSEMRE